jgi:hypothetical protein
MLGRTIPAAAGYPQYSGTALLPTIHSDRVLVKFYSESIFPMITTTDYLDEIKGMGDTVTFLRESCGVQVRDMVKDGNIEHDTLEITECAFSIGQLKGYSIKIDSLDKMMMGDRWERVREIAINKASHTLSKGIDCEIMALMATEAHCANTGPTAGLVSQMYNLGQVGAPVALTSANVLQKLSELQAVLDEQEIDRAGRFLVAPYPLGPVLMNSEMRSACFSNCNNGTSTYVTGMPPMHICGFDIYFSNCVPHGLDPGTNSQCYYLLAGMKQATAFASILDQSRVSDDAPRSYDVFYQGRMAYGYAVIYPEALASMYVRFA